jgi:hypothetical protein
MVAKAKTKKDERRRQRKIQQLQESESRWWQKIVFDLGKVRAARASLAEANGEKVNPLMTLEAGASIDLDEIAEIIEGRIGELMDATGKGRYARRKG